jgi:hypothetical protein
MQGVSERALQWYSKFYCVASVTKTFILKGVLTIHSSTFLMFFKESKIIITIIIPKVKYGVLKARFVQGVCYFVNKIPKFI